MAGMVFSIRMTDVAEGGEYSFVSMPSDYVHMSAWADEAIPEGCNETVEAIHRNYSLAWHTLKRRGKLGAMGLPGELTLDSIDDMESRFTCDVDIVEGTPLPLAEELP